MLFFAIEVFSQAGKPNVQTVPPPQDNTWWFVSLGLMLVIMTGAFWVLKSKRGTASSDNGFKKRQKGDKKVDNEPVDADKELEWLRKNQKFAGKREKPKFPSKLPQTSKVLGRNNVNEETEVEEVSVEMNVLREKMQNIQFTQLPIVNFNEIKKAKEFTILPISNSSDLMSAVEQAQDEFEEDEEVRDLSLRILAAFKTRNSIESLSQIALYDVSSSLRSKAVTVLSEFDHESVFETILLACADPTREVRAAAARGLFKLSFDRADAWTRLAETNDEFRMKQAARAAVEADLVGRSLDRLVHEDLKVAYEAFALTNLLVKAGETEQIFKAIENHTDQNVKLALLQTLKVIKDETTLPNLYELLEKDSISSEIKQKIDEVILSFEMVAA